MNPSPAHLPSAKRTPMPVCRLERCIRVLLVGTLASLPGLLNGQMIIAHRGASHEAPENTLAAFELAWKQDADGIEGDFRLTKDGQIVCLHDADTKRTSGTQLIAAQSTLADLQALDVGRWKHDRYTGERMPTLDQVLLTVPADKKIFVEVKCGPEILPALLRSIESSQVKWNQVCIISFNETVIAGAARELPLAKRYWLTGFEESADGTSWDPGFDEIAATLSNTEANGLDCRAETNVVTPGFVKRLKDAGWEFHCWTIDDVGQAGRFRDLGAQSITTNRPGELIKHLRSPD